MIFLEVSVWRLKTGFMLIKATNVHHPISMQIMPRDDSPAVNPNAYRTWFTIGY